MTESVGILERLANDEEPPISRQELEDIRDEFADPDSDKAALRARLAETVKAFRRGGDVKQWSFEVLERIDDCFTQHFMVDKELATWAFVPNESKNLHEYGKYCAEVDRILTTYSNQVPRYARHWFAFQSIWEVQGHAFPVPLGTSLVVTELDKLLYKYREGVIEVSDVLLTAFIDGRYGG